VGVGGNVACGLGVGVLLVGVGGRETCCGGWECFVSVGGCVDCGCGWG
jgi:hypothetical protein